jgi:MoxR-like ATPase
MMKKRAEPMLLWGASGSGKSVMISHIARIIGLDLCRHNFGPTTTESKVDGYPNLINGEFVKGILYRPYTTGRLFNPEEVDAAESSVLPAMNTPLSDTEYRFPNGLLVRKHNRFVCIATSNTNGSGASGSYTRNPMDGAFLDRFHKVKLNYDNYLELKLTKDHAITRKFHGARKVLDSKNNTTTIISFRSIVNGVHLYESGIEKDVVKIAHETWGYQMSLSEISSILTAAQ